VHSTRSRKW